MKEYLFKGTCNSFMFVTLGSPWYTPTTEEIINITSVIRKYKMSAEDICLIPFVSAVYFPKIQDDDYVFILKINSTFSLTEADVASWEKCFLSIGEPVCEGECPMIIGHCLSSLERIKKVLLPFR